MAGESTAVQPQISAPVASGGGKGGGVPSASSLPPLSGTNYGAGRYVTNPGQQRGANWSPKTYQARSVIGSGQLGSPSFGTGEPIMGGGYGDMGGGSSGSGGPTGSLGAALGGEVGIGPGISNPFGRMGQMQNDLASIYGLNNMTVTPGFFAPGGEGYAGGDYGSNFGGGGYSGGGGEMGGYGSADAGSTGAGSDVGSDGGGDGTGSGGQTGGDGWAKGGMVTKKRLVGPNPKGKDDGYGALDAGEVVIPASIVRKLAKKKG